MLSRTRSLRGRTFQEVSRQERSARRLSCLKRFFEDAPLSLLRGAGRRIVGYREDRMLALFVDPSSVQCGLRSDIHVALAGLVSNESNVAFLMSTMRLVGRITTHPCGKICWIVDNSFWVA